MTYWRMQLHPAKPGQSVAHCVESLAAEYIGLDFDRHLGDLMTLSKADLPDGAKDYWAFAHEMRRGDRVLIIAHHFPFAVATVEGDYNYIRTPVPEIGVWFRHFRSVRNVRYFADYVTNAGKWEQIRMTDTISPLRDPNSKSYRLLEEWK